MARTKWYAESNSNTKLNGEGIKVIGIELVPHYRMVAFSYKEACCIFGIEYDSFTDYQLRCEREVI